MMFVDFDFCDCDMQDDYLQDTGEVLSGVPSDCQILGHDISFKAHVDDLYDPEINRANDHLAEHTEDLLHARTSGEAQAALDHIHDDRRSIDYWEKSKQSALIESEKTEIFLDGINAKLEILERYRK